MAKHNPSSRLRLQAPDNTVMIQPIPLNQAPAFLLNIKKVAVLDCPFGPSTFGKKNWGAVSTGFQFIPAAPWIDELPRPLPFIESACFKAFEDVFIYGKEWSETEWFQSSINRINQGTALWGCSTQEELYRRYNVDIRDLYSSIKTYGFLDQNTIARNSQSDEDFNAVSLLGRRPISASHEIKIGVNQYNEILFLDGRHRLAIALILGIEWISVKLVFMHKCNLNLIKKLILGPERLEGADIQELLRGAHK